MRREVVITGIGVACPLGVGRDAFWSALDQGQSGIDWMPQIRGKDLPFRFAGLVKGFDPKLYVQPRKTIKVMCQEIQIAYAAAGLAMEDAGLTTGAVDPDRLGVVLGSEMLYGDLSEMLDVYRHCVESEQFKHDLWGEFAFKDLFPLWMLKYLPNMAACHISIAHDARSHNNSIVEGGVSSLLAVWEAVSAIERGHADVMLAGGSGSFASFSCLPFRGWEQLSKWQGDPAGASRPFDAGRSGSVVGEGAAVLILEERSRAESREAKILARIAGFASRFEPPGDPWKRRTGRAIRQSIEGALASAKMQPADIGHVNAHGEGAIEHDRLEAQAIRDLLGDVPVTAPKSMFGDLAAGSGAVELAASVLALEHGRVPRTLNYDDPDPACPINVVHGQSLPVEKRTALVLNQAITGQATALVIAAT